MKKCPICDCPEISCRYFRDGGTGIECQTISWKQFINNALTKFVCYLTFTLTDGAWRE